MFWTSGILQKHSSDRLEGSLKNCYLLEARVLNFLAVTGLVCSQYDLMFAMSPESNIGMVAAMILQEFESTKRKQEVAMPTKSVK
jgi:hypothetical protein